MPELMECPECGVKCTPEELIDNKGVCDACALEAKLDAERDKTDDTDLHTGDGEE